MLFKEPHGQSLKLVYRADNSVQIERGPGRQRNSGALPRPKGFLHQSSYRIYSNIQGFRALGSWASSTRSGSPADPASVPHQPSDPAVAGFLRPQSYDVESERSDGSLITGALEVSAWANPPQRLLADASATFLPWPMRAALPARAASQGAAGIAGTKARWVYPGPSRSLPRHPTEFESRINDGRTV